MIEIVHIVLSITVIVIVYCGGYKTGAKLNDRILKSYRNEREFRKTLEKSIDLLYETNESLIKVNRKLKETNDKLFEELKKKG